MPLSGDQTAPAASRGTRTYVTAIMAPRRHRAVADAGAFCCGAATDCCRLLLIQRGGRTTYFGALGLHSSSLVEYLQRVPGVLSIQVAEERYAGVALPCLTAPAVAALQHLQHCTPIKHLHTGSSAGATLPLLQGCPPCMPATACMCQDPLLTLSCHCSRAALPEARAQPRHVDAGGDRWLHGHGARHGGGAHACACLSTSLAKP
jgi:hypothetical protein